jgi:hypothetical protein
MSTIKVPVADLPKGVPGLVRWIKFAHPVMYNELAARLKSRSNYLNGLGVADPRTVDSTIPVTPIVAASTPGWGTTLLNTIKEILPAAVQTYQQGRIFDLQIKRAQAGQAPLDTTALSDAASFRVGVDTATRNTALYIAGGLAVAFIGYKLILGKR